MRQQSIQKSMAVDRPRRSARPVWRRRSFTTFWLAVASSVWAGTAQPAEIAWRKDVQAAAREAAARRKSILIMVKARWCGPCHQMLQQSWSNPSVVARVNADFIPLLIDADEQAALIQQLNVNAFPTTLILDSSQRVVDRATGFQSAGQLNARLAVFKPVGIRPPLRPIEIHVSRPPEIKTSFHERAWAAIRNSSSLRPPPEPRLEPRPPVLRDTLSAAKEFSAAR
jgi:hypothetical protein